MLDRVLRVVVALSVVLLFSRLAAAATPGEGIRSIAAANRTACAIRNDGALFCWGWSHNGQVGAGRISEKESNPIEVFKTGVSAVSIGYAHVCAIVDGGLFCWGWNNAGQIGTRKSGEPVLTPARVFERDVTAVAAGGMHTCAIVGGALLCWGDNEFGELGGKANGLEPVRVFDGGVTAVAAQAQNTCAIVRGALWCWGDNRNGQVGNGATGVSVIQPFKVIDRDVDAVAFGVSHACATVAQALKCWGATHDGHIGQSGKSEDWTLKPQTVIATGVTAFATGTAHDCAVVGGALQCWGYSSMHNIRSGKPAVVPAPETIIAHGVTAVAAAEGITCALVDDALRCRGYEGYGVPLTVGHAQYQGFDFAAGDVRTLDRNAADAADARARLPGEVAHWLVGKRVTDGHFAYLVTRAGATVDKDIDGNDAYTRMTLDVVALYALNQGNPASDDHNTTPIDATIPPAAVCGRDIEGRARIDQNTPFIVLKDDRFVAVNTATEGRFAKLAPMASGGGLLERSLRLGAADLKKLDACTRDTLARIDKQPLAGVALYAGDTLITRMPATPDADWTIDNTDHPVSKIVIEPKRGSAADYAIDVRANSSMVCDGLVLANWKHGESIPWQLARTDNGFELYRETLEKEAPQFPRYTAAELRAAIEDAKKFWSNEKPVDPATCHEMLTDETYTIRKGGEVVQTIESGWWQPPVPAVPFECEGERGGLAEHVAGDLGYPMAFWDQDSHMACKAMPDAPGTAIVTIETLQKGSGYPDDPTSGAYDLDVLVVDIKTRHVLARSLQKDAFNSDAWRFNGTQIDTGRYRLANGVRAFGVRAGSGSSSHYSAAEDTTLSLYVRDGKHLRNVLSGLLVHSVRGENSDSCNGDLSTLERTIDIAPTSSHGFADVIVTSRVTTSTQHDDGSDCKEVKGAATVEHLTLRYDGKEYVVPNALNQFP